MQIVSLHHKTHIAQLWEDGALRAGTPERAAALLLAVKQELARLGLLAWDEPVNLAMPARGLLWPAAALLAQERGLRLHRAVCGGAPDDPDALALKAGQWPAAPQPVLWRGQIAADLVTDARRENFIRQIDRNAEYVLHPQTARSYNALQDYRVMTADGTPAVVLALCDPAQAAAELCRILQLPDADALTRRMQTGRKRFLEY